MNRLFYLTLAACTLLVCAPAVAQEASDVSRKAGPTPDTVLEFRHPEGGLAAVIEVEIADRPATRARGLMGRDELACSRGMLFIFEQSQRLSFWMHNTLIPLDIFFIDDQGTIFDIVHEAPPMSDTVYSPARPGLYVVETCAGFARRRAIVPGVRVDWHRQP